MDPSGIERIAAAAPGSVLPREPLSRHTTYRVGGEAELLVVPETAEIAASVYRLAKRERVPLTIIGAGSNVIAPDDGIEGIVLCTASRTARIELLDGFRLRAEGGALLSDVARAACRAGYAGLEQLGGIPGTAGGAVVMNAGTREVETAGVVAKAEVLMPSGRRRTFTARELGFEYRRSALLGTDWLLTSVEYRLSRGEPAALEALMGRVFAERESKFPLDSPSAGSVFKRPPGDFAGRLIELAGCKGLRRGGAVVSERHANFIVNGGGATSADVMELIALVRKRVYETTGVYLELEQIPLPRTPRA